MTGYTIYCASKGAFYVGLGLWVLYPTMDRVLYTHEYDGAKLIADEIMGEAGANLSIVPVVFSGDFPTSSDCYISLRTHK